MGKHAYLIIAHKDNRTLDSLMVCLDDARNDIFIHMDIKNKSFDFSKFSEKIKHAGIYEAIPRINVTWGGVLTD